MSMRDSRSKGWRTGLHPASPQVTSPATDAGRGHRRRSVVTVENRLAISSLLHFLLEGLDYEGEEALGGRATLGTINRDSFDAILLDLRYPDTPAEQPVFRFTRLESTLVDRVLAISADVEDPSIVELIKRHCVGHGLKAHLRAEIRRWLHNLWEPSSHD
jgi:CheY-like chemotaxis protein